VGLLRSAQSCKRIVSRATETIDKDFTHIRLLMSKKPNDIDQLFLECETELTKHITRLSNSVQNTLSELMILGNIYQE
jgi:hypothetical protein